MKFSCGILAISLMFGASAYAAPADWKDRLPEDVEGMKPVEVMEEDGKLVAFYGESVGRATITVQPMPEAPAGQTGYDAEAVSGKTAGAQAVWLSALANNLAAGTKALGDSYDTSIPKFEPVDIKNEDGSGLMETSCGSILRRQASEGEEALHLLDRVCVTGKGDDVITVAITTPTDEAQLEEVNQAQLRFVAAFLEQLTSPAE